MADIRKSTFGEISGGTTFHSFAINGTFQPFVKTDRTYREPIKFNAIYMGHGVNSGTLVFFKDGDGVEIDKYPWEV
ncbi:MAG TPA: hypothetical protein VJI33_01350 [Candidatus Paceibacterota bacterium]